MRPVAIDKLYFSCHFAAPENASADPRRTDAKTLIAFPPVKCVPEKTPAAAATCLLFPGIYADAPSAPSGAALLRVPRSGRPHASEQGTVPGKIARSPHADVPAFGESEHAVDRPIRA